MTPQEQQLFIFEQAKQRKINQLEEEMKEAKGYDKLAYRNKIKAMNTPKKRLPTYGEYMVAHGNKEVDSLKRTYFQPRMSKEQAGWYYNAKLRTYWLNQLTDFPYHVRNKVLDYLLGGSR